MTSRIRNITFDCRDPYAQAQFWSAVLGFTEHPDNPNVPDDPMAWIVDPLGQHPGLLFIPVPESKAVKNRVHLDLEPLTDARDVTVDACLALGATLVDDHRKPTGGGWAVLADPEGNEFCVERPRGERGDGAEGAGDRPGWGARPMPDVRTSDERAMLEAMLDWYREGVVDRVRGLTDEQSRRRLVGSPTTVIGLVKHLALVEDSWFTHRFAGGDEPAPWADAPFDDDPDWEFHSALDDTLDDMVALYEQACARSRAAIADAALDDRNRLGERPFTLRWMLLHLIEETARHLGHLDILREIIDGRAGD